MDPDQRKGHEDRQAGLVSQAILDSANVSIISTDVDGIIRTFNKGAERLLGYSAEELVGLATPALIHDRQEVIDHAARLSAELGCVIEPGFEVFVARARLGTADENEWTYLRKDGVRIPVLLSVTAIRDEAARLTGFLGVASDLSERKRQEERLRESEARYRSVITAMAEGVVVQDAGGRIVSTNTSALKILGLTEDQLMGRSSLDPQWQTVSEDGTALLGERHPSMVTLRTGVPQHEFIMGVQKPSGDMTWISINTEPIYAEGDDKPHAVVASFHDITERRRAEQSLYLQGRVIETAVNGIVIADALRPDTPVVYVNPAFTRITGYSREQAVGRNCRFLQGPETRQPPLDELRRAITERRGTRVVLHNYRPDGTAFWNELTLSPVSDAAGRVTHFVGIQQDVTERVEATESLNRFKNVLDNTLDMIFMFEPDSLRFVYFNRGALEAMGYAAEELLQMHPWDIKPKLPEPEFRRFIASLLSGEKAALNFETMHRRKDGTDIPVEIFLQLVREGGGKGLFVAIVHDITERRQVERMKSEFVSTVSHELRTPLTSIRGSLGLIMGGMAQALPDEVRNLLEIAHKNSERLALLINDLLDMEKIVSGKMRFDLRPYMLMDLVDQSVRANQVYAQRHGVHLGTATGPSRPLQVMADADRFIQVMSNLLSNAAKFSPRGGEVEVRVGLRGQRVRVEVVDHGPGIPETFRARMFEKFSQADASDARQQGGTGLGLSISKALVEQMGGEIGFESAEGAGSTFHVEFPVLSERAA